MLYRVGVAQFEPQFLAKDKNLEKMVDLLSAVLYMNF